MDLDDLLWTVIGMEKRKHQLLPEASSKDARVNMRLPAKLLEQVAGLNPLTAIIVYWNTLHLGHAVDARRREGLDTPEHLLAHVSPLGWAHILLTGEYLWSKDTGA